MLLASAAIAAAAPAFAQDAPTSPFTITGGATLTSDYRFRGISQTDKRFAVQGTASISHSSGLYASFWGSSIDDYVENGGDAELDLIAGYKKTVNGTTIDGGFLYYYYPGSGGVKSDFFEPYISASHTFGPVGVKVGGNFAWKQHGLGVPNDGSDRASGAYAYGELSGAIPHTGVTLTGHVGHSFVRNYITFGDHYTDWSVTAAYTWKALTFSAAYVDTNRDFESYPVPGTGRDRDVSKSGFVGAVAVAF
jgi:uncharacterized protein (TIGR02001 family)